MENFDLAKAEKELFNEQKLEEGLRECAYQVYWSKDFDLNYEWTFCYLLEDCFFGVTPYEVTEDKEHEWLMKKLFMTTFAELYPLDTEMVADTLTLEEMEVKIRQIFKERVSLDEVVGTLKELHEVTK